MRREQASCTQEVLLPAAERLFAEHGVFAVSNRQVSEVSGRGNNTAAGSHFGLETDVVWAIAEQDRGSVEQLREHMRVKVCLTAGGCCRVAGLGGVSGAPAY